MMNIKFDARVRYAVFHNPEVSSLSILTDRCCDGGGCIGDGREICVMIDEDHRFNDLEFFMHDPVECDCLLVEGFSVAHSLLTVDVPREFRGRWLGNLRASAGWIVIDEAFSSAVGDWRIIRLGESCVYVALVGDMRLAALFVSEIIHDPGSRLAMQWLDTVHDGGSDGGQPAGNEHS